MGKVFLSIWLTGIGFGIFQLLAYENTPGAPSNSPANWPENKLITQSNSKPTLVMMLHPRCRSSKASLRQLANLNKASPEQLENKILFFLPETEEEDWSKKELWQLASEIPNAEIKLDRNGEVSKLFGAVTSGHTAFYGTDRNLIFSGGLTRNRGIVGSGVGVASISSYLNHLPIAVKKTHTFGCTIRNEKNHSG